VALLIELPIDNGEGLSSMCKVLDLYFVGREYLMEEAVEVWCPPISLRVRVSRWVLIDFCEHEDIRSRFRVSPRG
jgi:hypothetical protein